MGWFMNDDPRDDENELEVKWTMIIGFVGMAVIMFMTVTLLTGCSQHVKVFECKLDCADKSGMECRTSVATSELDLD